MTEDGQIHVNFQIGYHAELTEEANAGVLDAEQLGFVVAANIAQDLYQTNSAIHFDNCDFPGGSAHIAAEWNVIEQTGDRYATAALAAFGALLHTTQDFYAHSNWIELHVDASPIPLWDQNPATLPPGIVSGTWWIGGPKLCGPNAPTHDELNKDSPKSKEGSKIVPSGPNAGKSLFTLAYSAALAATRVQYDRFAQAKVAKLDLAAAGGAPRGLEAVGMIIRAQQQLRACH